MSTLCFAVLGLLGFGPACSDSPPLRCERYAQVLRDPQRAQALEDWYAGLPERLDPATLKYSDGTLDGYEIPLKLDPASLGLDATAVAAVSLDRETQAVTTASITDGQGVYFVFPPQRLETAYGQKALKLPRTRKVGIYCHQRD
jgi:hypothetical protein